MNKRQFLQLIDKYYFNYDLREIRVTIWTGYSSSYNYLDSWLTVDCYNENGDFIQEISDYLIDLYSNIEGIENIDNSTLEERQRLMKDQQKIVTKIRKSDEYIPFGPFIVIGAFISMYVPFEQIKNLLLQIFTLGMYQG